VLLSEAATSCDFQYRELSRKSNPTQVEVETGAGLPDFVKAEFDAFLHRGILSVSRRRFSIVVCISLIC
jgi:hypothetical protein